MGLPSDNLGVSFRNKGIISNTMLLEIWNFISAWYNLPFTILLGLGMLMAALQLVGLGGGDDSDSDMDHDVAVDHSVDLDHAIEVDHDIDLQHDVDLDHALDVGDHDIGDMESSVEHEIGHDVSEGAGSALTLLAFLGVGKTPLMVVLLMLFTLTGMLGWLLNNLVLVFLGRYPGFLVLLVLPAAVVGSGLITSRVARFIGELLPPISTTVSRAQALVGMHGIVISPFVDAKYGMVHLRNPGGTLISIFAVTGDAEAVKRGDEVILLSYDEAKRIYLVTRSINPIK